MRARSLGPWFGGATALLPVYTKEILHVGPQGLGLLRSAPAVGALCVGCLLFVAITSDSNSPSGL
jgi:hypothetical protein